MKTFTYTTHAGGNTTYAGLRDSEKRQVISTLRQGLYDLLERSNHHRTSLELLHLRDPQFRKQTDVDAKLDNSLGSFVSGVLSQHETDPTRDFAMKQLEGIEAATRAFNYINNKIDCIEFKDSGETTKYSDDPLGALMSRLENAND